MTDEKEIRCYFAKLRLEARRRHLSPVDLLIERGLLFERDHELAERRRLAALFVEKGDLRPCA